MSRFAKYTWIVLGWNVLVILWGTMVRATGSGAGCGSHWPRCNGAIIPDLQQSTTAIEFTHRMMSGAALLLVLGMLIWGLRAHREGHPVRTGVKGAAAFILIEALLGAGLVLFELTGDNDSTFRAVAVAVHLLNTFILLAWLTLTAYWASGGSRLTLAGKKGWGVLVITAALMIAALGMSGAITALGDTLFPSTSIAATLETQADPNAHFLVQLRVYHPLIAVAVGLAGLYLLRSIYARFAPIRRLVLALGALVFVQWAAGLVNVLLLAPLWMQVVHLLIADLVWILFVIVSASILSEDNPV